MIGIKTIIKGEALETVKNGIKIPITVNDIKEDEDFENIKAINDKLLAFENGRKVFSSAVKIMGDAVLNKLPMDCEEIELSLVAEVK